VRITTLGGDCGDIAGTGTAANENNCDAAAVDEIALAAVGTNEFVRYSERESREIGVL